MFRWIYVLAAALSVLFGADVLASRAKTIPSSVSVVTEIAVSYRTSTVRCPLIPRSAPQWRDGARPTIESEALETELTDSDIVDGDSDPRSEVTFHSAISIRGISGRRPAGVASRGEAQTDTSRFAIEGGLPRGPPAVRFVI